MRFLLALAAAFLLSAAPAAAATQVTVDPQRSHQRVDGFGFSEAFQRSNILHGLQGLSPAKQKQVLDLLFTPAGADFSLLRNGIGSSTSDRYDLMKTIEPVSPGSPDATPNYVWDGNDNSQVWLSKQALRRGVRAIYADAWSAPGFMKTNGSDSNGGSLDPAWAQAYANYLVEYLRLYKSEGIPISLVGFVNEPDIATSYASMVESPQQAADFVKVLGPTLARSGLGTRIACCDATGWNVGKPYIDAILSDPDAARWLGVATAHGYSSPPAYPLTNQRPVWETEWAHLGTPWDPAWDDGTPGAGIVWAQNVIQSFTQGDVNAFFYWWGAHGSNSNSGLIQMLGDSYNVSKRFWAIAAFSRFVHPGAVRVDASSSLPVSAFRNRDGSLAVQVLNTGAAATSIDLAVGGAHIARPYLVDGAHDLTPGTPQPVDNGQLHATIPARALETFVVR